MAKQKIRTRAARLEPELNKRIEAATKEGGFANPSAFMRAAFERELAGRLCRAWTRKAGFHSRPSDSEGKGKNTHPALAQYRARGRIGKKGLPDG